MNRNDFLAKSEPNLTIQQHVDNLLENAKILYDFGYVSDKTYDLLRKACIYHDDGKANIEFQNRIKNNSTFDEEKEIPHNILSGYFIDKNEFDSLDDYEKVLFSVLYHHNYIKTIDKQYLNDNKELINELLKPFDNYKITTKTLNNINDLIINQDKDSIKIKGMLNRCDYAASGNYKIEYKNDFLADKLDLMMKNWKINNPSANWNDLQEYCLKNKDKNLIVIAQTGMGKTEAGLQWIGDNKGYFVLPLRAAINAIYDRIKENILNNEKIDERLSLLHSESLDYYLKQSYKESYDLFKYDKKGKNLSMPLSISTMDQLFDFGIKYVGYEMKLSTFAYSKIVIDEIQMYDPELLAYLVYGLKMITEMGGKVMVMTATLAPFLRDIIKNEIKINNEATFVNDLVRHNIKTINKELNSEDIAKFYRENKTNRKKIIVICNTVKKAQQIYNELKSQEIEELHILHSRYIKKDRLDKEDRIMEFGKTYDKNGNIDEQSGIWITTQVVEASMDIDFDYLFTELQDLNSVMQRLGRCNRKGVKSVKDTNCFIYTEIDPKLIEIKIDKITKKSSFFIDPTLFKLSKQAIETVNGIITESEKIKLIEKYLTTDNLKNSNYYKKYKNAMEFMKNIYSYQYEKGEEKLRNIVSDTIIPSEIYLKNKTEIDDLSNKCIDQKIKYIDRIKYKSKIMDYTVNVPHYYIENYQKAKNAGTAIPYNTIKVSPYEEIQILECLYDELGVIEIKFAK